MKEQSHRCLRDSAACLRSAATPLAAHSPALETWEGGLDADADTRPPGVCKRCTVLGYLVRLGRVVNSCHLTIFEFAILRDVGKKVSKEQWGRKPESSPARRLLLSAYLRPGEHCLGPTHLQPRLPQTARWQGLSWRLDGPLDSLSLDD